MNNMGYPFVEGNKYLNAKEQEAFDAFLSEEPQSGDTYTNEKGEVRLCGRIFYPQGAKTDQTVHIRKKDGRTYYFTPGAETLGPNEKCAMISFYCDDEWKRCTSTEWLAWLGAKFEQKKPKPTPQISKKKAEAIVAMHERSIPSKDGDNVTKGAKWSKPRNKKS